MRKLAFMPILLPGFLHPVLLSLCSNLAAIGSAGRAMLG